LLGVVRSPLPGKVGGRRPGRVLPFQPRILECRGQCCPGEAKPLDRPRTTVLRPSFARSQLGDDAESLCIAFKAVYQERPRLGAELIRRIRSPQRWSSKLSRLEEPLQFDLGDVTERRMPEIVSKPSCIQDIRIQPSASYDSCVLGAEQEVAGSSFRHLA